ncbi:hypothetical protein PIB30_005397, partial [Stylosanthes scabra]|nr:hypothetical protein [Stylosanthes scabra]
MIPLAAINPSSHILTSTISNTSTPTTTTGQTEALSSTIPTPAPTPTFFSDPIPISGIEINLPISTSSTAQLPTVNPFPASSNTHPISTRSKT